MIKFATVLAALCSASALKHDEARVDVVQQGGFYQRSQQQTLLQQTQQQLQQLQQQQDLLLEQQQQLVQVQRLHHHRQPPQSRDARPPTQQRGAQLHDQAPRHPQPRRAAIPLQLLQQEPMGMYSLRLCNAYAWPVPVTMSRVEEPKLLEYPLAYKECHDYLLPLREGDQLQFRTGDVSIGTFSVRGLPEDPNSLLLLIPHRRDEGSATVAFDSHIFHEGSGAQVAVVDTYRGPEQSTLLVGEKTSEKEELSFNSVVNMVPGSYKLALAGWGLSNARKAGASAQLQIQGNRSYVVLRVGAARSSLGTEAYPEELVVFPSAQMSSAARGAVSAAVFVFVSCMVAA